MGAMREPSEPLTMTTAPARRKSLPQRMHQRAATEYQIDAIGFDRRDEPAMQRLALRP